MGTLPTVAAITIPAVGNRNKTLNDKHNTCMIHKAYTSNTSIDLLVLLRPNILPNKSPLLH